MRLVFVSGVPLECIILAVIFLIVFTYSNNENHGTITLDFL